MKFTPLFLLLFLCSFGIAQAQSDYVVTLAGDTIKGKIKVSFGVKFKGANQTEFKKITTDEYKTYYVAKDSTSYVKGNVPGIVYKEAFLRRIQNGRIQLLEWFVGGVTTGMGGTSPSSTFWYGMKDNGPNLEIKSSQIFGSRDEREKNFYALIGDYPALLEDFKAEKSYSFEIIESYIKKYNYYFKYLKK